MHFAALSAPAFDLTGLSALSSVIDQVADGSMRIIDADDAIDQIKHHAAAFGTLPVGLGYALCGAGFGVLLSLGWGNVLFAALCGFRVFLLTQLAGRWRVLEQRLEFVAGVVTALAAGGLAVLAPGSNPTLVILCGLVVLIPGFALTLGIAEIASGLLVSGLPRFAFGLMALLKLFLGAIFGDLIFSQFFNVPDTVAAAGAAELWVWLFVALMVIELSIIFQVRLKDFGWAVLGGLVTYAGMVLGGTFGPLQGSFLGAMTLAVYANLFAWKLQRPTSIVMNPCIMVIVPGAAAFLGLQTAATGGAQAGMIAEWMALINIGAILAGIFAAHIIVPPKATL